jgi:Zn-dependent oligopeptidase
VLQFDFDDHSWKMIYENAMFDFSPEDIDQFSEYFPYTKFRDNFFGLCTKLFGIKFQVSSQEKERSLETNKHQIIVHYC